MKKTTKQLLIMAAIILNVIHNASAADCNITLKAKSVSASAGKLDGVSFSKKHIKALKGMGCSVSIEMMSRAELLADFEKNLDKKIAKAAQDKLEE